MRPVHVRKEQRTHGHLLVVMPSYQLMKELGRRWAHLDLTVNEGLERLNTCCAVEVAGVIKVMLEPRADVQALLHAARVNLPTQLHVTSPKAATKNKLPDHRPTRKKQGFSVLRAPARKRNIRSNKRISRLDRAVARGPAVPTIPRCLPGAAHVG